MRRKDREISSIAEILGIIERNKVLRIAMVDNGKPYIVPINYGYTYEYDKLVFYFHCAKCGRKIDLLKVNNNICFEIDSGHALLEGSTDCNYGYLYESVVGEGKFSIISNSQDQNVALTHLMNHQTNQHQSYNFELKDKILVCQLEISAFSAKSRKPLTTPHPQP